MILDLDPATYVPHVLHRRDRIWAETNCYTDVVVELLHANGHEPLAALAFTLAVDLEVDQWTFFKLPQHEIQTMFAVGFHELTPWRALAWHIGQMVAAGRHVLVDLDAFFLPDTAGTSYRCQHQKTTVAVNHIDLTRQRLGYFHNQGYHELHGRDFVDVLQVDGVVHERFLQPFIEFVKPIPRARPLAAAPLVDASVASLRLHLSRAPESNPFVRFKQRFADDLPEIVARHDLEEFHGYSFATLRQHGAAFELAAVYLRWLANRGVDGTLGAAAEFERIAQGSKALQLRFARAVTRRSALDLGPVDALAASWDAGMDALRGRFS